MCSDTYIGRFCAIDIGTVTCRMLVADAFKDAQGRISLKQLSKQYRIVNLGEGVDSTRMLSEEALARTGRALKDFMEVRASFDEKDMPISYTTTIATSATRDAKNSEEFKRMLGNIGLTLQVLSGNKEAALSFLGASSSYPDEDVVVVDVGGGSTEITAGSFRGGITYSRSFNIGSKRLTERYWEGYPPSAESIQNAFKESSRTFAKIPSSVNCSDRRLIAVAGTATSAVTIDMKMREYDADKVNGAVVSSEKLHRMAAELSHLDLNALEHVEGLDPKRAPVIVAGMMALEEAMRALSAPSFTASETDILEGIVMYNAIHYEEAGN